MEEFNTQIPLIDKNGIRRFPEEVDFIFESDLGFKNKKIGKDEYEAFVRNWIDYSIRPSIFTIETDTISRVDLQKDLFQVKETFEINLSVLDFWMNVDTTTYNAHTIDLVRFRYKGLKSVEEIFNQKKIEYNSFSANIYLNDFLNIKFLTLKEKFNGILALYIQKQPFDPKRSILGLLEVLRKSYQETIDDERIQLHLIPFANYAHEVSLGYNTVQKYCKEVLKLITEKIDGMKKEYFEDKKITKELDYMADEMAKPVKERYGLNVQELAYLKGMEKEAGYFEDVGNTFKDLAKWISINSSSKGQEKLTERTLTEAINNHENLTPRLEKILFSLNKVLVKRIKKRNNSKKRKGK